MEAKSPVFLHSIHTYCCLLALVLSIDFSVKTFTTDIHPYEVNKSCILDRNICRINNRDLK